MAGIGVIGLGVMGARMLGQIGRHHGLDAVIAWDPSDAALERALDTSPGLIRAGSVDEVTAFPDIACVYIASPPSSHLDYIELACEQGKAVFCEKPLALDDVAARAVVERIERDGHPAAMNFPHASAPAAVALARELDNGRIGAIEQVSVEIVFPQWPESWQIAAAWLCKRAQGGFVREVVTHKLFLARRLLGPLELVHADITWPDDAQGAETAADIRVKAGGVPVHVRGRVEAGATEVVHWTVTGERGALRLFDWYGLEEMAADRTWREHARNRPYDPAGARLAAAQAQLDSLDALLAGGVHAMATLREGLDVQRMIEAILRS